MERKRFVQKRRRPRQIDVARLAKVSPAVVSVVVNGRTDTGIRVSAETERRVQEAIRALGYTPNQLAASLARGESRMLGVFTFEPVFPDRTGGFYFPFLVGIEEEAEAQGYDLLLFTSASIDGDRRRLYRDGVNRLQLADGAVLMGREEDKGEIRALAEDGYPFVYVGRRVIPGAEISYVGAEYARATGDIVRHLAEFGHRRMAYVGDPAPAQAEQDREHGFRDALAGLAANATEPCVWRPQAEDATSTVLDAALRAGITAILAETEAIAERLSAECRARGLDVPEDLSMAVLGAPSRSDELPIAWTTFRIPRADMGRHAVRLLLQVLAADRSEPTRIMLPCTFVPGESTGPAPASARRPK